MRRLRIVLALALLATVVPALPAAPATDVVRFSGGGWGHGVGLSQYGAQGQALEGRTAEQILAHYYTGTGLNPIDTLALSSDALTTVPEALWVGLLADQSSITIEAVGGPLDLCQVGDGEGPCPRADHPQPGEAWTFSRVDAGCRFFRNGEATGAQVGSCRASIDWDEATTRVKIEGIEYAYGTVKMRTEGVASGNFHVSLAIDLEPYLRGIAEMPTSWEQEALRSQVIAARTYAVSRFLIYEDPALRTEFDAGLGASRKTDCWCHVHDSTADQVYTGWAHETVPTGGNWLSAVSATAGLLVTYDGPDWPSITRDMVASTFYFSSSWGMTESVEDGFGSSTHYPYLVSVDDHWSADPNLNPLATWEKDVSTTTIAALLGWDTVDVVRLVNPAPGATVEFTGTLNGSAVTASKGGSWLRGLELRSGEVLGVEGGSFFTDLEGNAHLEAIVTIWTAGITQGCSVGLYCPADSVERWQMALFLTRLWPLTGFELPSGNDQGFIDILDRPPDEQVSINQLAQLGITAGTSPTTFDPQGHVSRWQMALFLTRIVAATGIALPDGADQGFTDIGHLSAEAQTAINQLAQLGITKGTSDTTFSPDSDVRRDQMASFISRSMDLVVPVN